MLFQPFRVLYVNNTHFVSGYFTLKYTQLSKCNIHTSQHILLLDVNIVVAIL